MHTREEEGGALAHALAPADGRRGSPRSRPGPRIGYVSRMPAVTPEDAWAHNEWDILRELYTRLFGLPYDARGIIAPDEPIPKLEDMWVPDVSGPLDDACYELRFRGSGTARVYATFGAARWTGGAEIFVRSAAPFWPFSQRLDDLLGKTLSAGDVVSLDFTGSSLVGATFLPIGTGSLELPLPQGATTSRTLLQLVPLTAVEMELAKRDPSALVRALTDAGLIDTMDPLRASCVGDPETGPYWNASRLLFRAHAKRKLGEWAERHQMLVDMLAPPFIIENTADLVEEQSALLEFLDSHRIDAVVRRPGFERPN